VFDLIVLSRVFVDYFWEIKSLSVLHSFMGVCFAFFIAVHFKLQGYVSSIADKVIFIFYLCVIGALFKSINEDTLILFSKFSTYILFYFIGRVYPFHAGSNGFISRFSIGGLLIFSLLGGAGLGYSYWGNVRTFTGGYFFKADLAISVLVLLSFSFIYFKDKRVLFCMLALAAYLIFSSNARIAIPLLLIIPIFIILGKSGKLNELNFKAVFLSVASMLIGILAFTLIDFSSLGMLGFDFQDPFSEANTQGRSAIWLALLQAYSEASLVEQLFGMGLDGDVWATSMFSESKLLEGKHAHNSYLYLLICTGLVGMLTFLCFLIILLRQILCVIREGGVVEKEVALLSGVFFIMFIWLSLTIEVVIRPQLMVLFLFFSGLAVQASQNYKRQKALK